MYALPKDVACLSRTSRPAWLAPLSVALLCGLLSGCAALTNPVMDGLPVRRLPPELLAESQESKKTIPLHWLRQDPAQEYRLAAGDVLGVWVEGVLGAFGQNPPVQLPVTNLPPSIGYPIPVRENGTVSLPLLEPVRVKDMTVAGAEAAIRSAYVDAKILLPDKARSIVTLIRPREYHVLVIRQDAASSFTSATAGLFGTSQVSGGSKRGSGHVVDLPAYENDVLNALAKSGGFPGLDTTNEIIIQRGASRKHHAPADVRRDWEIAARDGKSPSAGAGNGETVRIPLRMRPGEPPAFKPEDVILHTGDIVFIEARDADLFYTAGLLPAGEHTLPRDRDLDVLQAVMQVRGPTFSGSFGSFNLAGTSVASGLGAPNASLLTVLRRTPGGGQIPIRVNLNRTARDARERILVKAGDVLILQETPGEAMTRYFTQQFNFTLIWRVFDRRDATGTSTTVIP